jgi:hypothetical protein
MDEFFESLRGAEWRSDYGMVAAFLPKYGYTHLYDVRGWGHLTGKGNARGYDDKTAIEIQSKLAELAADAVGEYRKRRLLMEDVESALAQIMMLADKGMNGGGDDAARTLDLIWNRAREASIGLGAEISQIESKGLDIV